MKPSPSPGMTLLTRALFGAALGALQNTGLAPGAAHGLVRDALKKLAKNKSAVEFIARAMHAHEAQDIKAWEALAKPAQDVFRERARVAFVSIAGLCEFASTRALSSLSDAQALMQILQRTQGETNGTGAVHLKTDGGTRPRRAAKQVATQLVLQRASPTPPPRR